MVVSHNPLLTLAVVLVAGVLSGEAAKRVHLPSVTGQLLVGVLMGPSVLRLFDQDALHGLEPITHFALGLMAVDIGNHLHVRRLRNAFKRLTLLLLLEATVTPAFVFAAVLIVPNADWTVGLLLAALAISTAPATILAVVKETRSKGVFVKTLIAAVALNNVACITLFETARTITRVSLNPQTTAGALDVFAAPLSQLGLSILLGALAGGALIAATRRVHRPDSLATASIIAILLILGLAELVGISSLLTCLFLGVTLANLTPEKEEIGHAVFANFETAILAVFFTLAGLEMDLSYAIPGGVLALLMVVARLAGKIVAARLAMGMAGATDRIRRCLGPALIPQAGVAVGLMLLVREDPAFSSINDLFLAVGLTVVTINEIIGPVMTRIALARSGDFGKDRARLIDFLHEEHIIADLKAETKDQAIEQLADRLIQSNDLAIDREQFLESVFAREAEMSTCLGSGLSMPHGVLPEGDTILGAMGISHDGLRFDTPDGQPVHCVILLATPPTHRDQHLEVLAAFSRAIGRDRSIQRELYSAKSAAHAYEVLHADEQTEDFNYFLDEAEEV